MIGKIHQVTTVQPQMEGDAATKGDFAELLKLDQVKLTSSEKEEALEMLWNHRAVFSLYEFDIGHTNLLELEFQLKDHTLIKQKFRRILPSLFEEVCQHLENMRASGVIRPSQSLWASSVV